VYDLRSTPAGRTPVARSDVIPLWI
jgi:hypothetical protein